MSGRGTGQQRAAEALRQQAVAEEQQHQAELAGDQQQPEGAQGADMGVVHTPPARAQAGEQPVCMLPDSAPRAFRLSVDGTLRSMQQQQAERDTRVDQEFARLAQVRARTRVHDDAHLPPLSC